MPVKALNKNKVSETSTDILKRLKTKGEKPVAVLGTLIQIDMSDSIKPKGCAALWVKTVPLYHVGVGRQHRITIKQLSFFRRMIELWGPLLTPNIIKYSIEHWIDYTKYAENVAGAFNLPVLPSIDFLYRYMTEAGNHWLARPKASTEEIVLGDGIPILKNPFQTRLKELVALPIIEEVEPEMTLEELLEWSAEKQAKAIADAAIPT